MDPVVALVIGLVVGIVIGAVIGALIVRSRRASASPSVTARSCVGIFTRTAISREAYAVTGTGTAMSSP